MTLAEYLLKNGWKPSAQMFALVSPTGVVTNMQTIIDMEPTFQNVVRDKKDFDAMAIAAKAASALPGLVSNTVHRTSEGGPVFPGHWGPYDKLKMRLNMARVDNFGLDCCTIFEGPNTTFVFVVKGEKALILEDQPSIFPSDKL